MCTGGPARCFSTEQGGRLATNVAKQLPSVADSNTKSCQQTHEHFEHYKSQFKEKCQLVEHVRAEHRVKPVACQQCPCTFARRNGLIQHVKRVHQNLHRYRCEICRKGFSVRSHYFDHVAAHTGSKRNICTICQTQFTYKRGLKAHVLRFHPNEAHHM